MQYGDSNMVNENEHFVHKFDNLAKMEKKTIYLYNPSESLLDWLDKIGVAYRGTRTGKLFAINDDYSLYILSSKGSVKARAALEERKKMTLITRIRSVLKKHNKVFSAGELSRILGVSPLEVSRACIYLVRRKEAFKDVVGGVELYYYNFEKLREKEEQRRKKVRGISTYILQALKMLRWGSIEEIIYILREKWDKNVPRAVIKNKLSFMLELGEIEFDGQMFYLIFGRQVDGRECKRYALTEKVFLHEVIQSGSEILLKPRMKVDTKNDAKVLFIDGVTAINIDTLKKSETVVEINNNIIIPRTKAGQYAKYYIIDTAVNMIKGVLEFVGERIRVRLNSPSEYEDVMATARRYKIVSSDEFLGVDCEYDIEEGGE